MGYRIGQQVRGKIWAGKDYGFQTPATYQKLKEQGAFKRGASAVRRIKQSVQRFYEKNAPQKVKDAVKWYGETGERENQRLLDRGYTQEQIDKAKAASAQLSVGSGEADAKAIKAISDKLNVAPEIVSGGVAVAQTLIEGRLSAGAARRVGQSRIRSRMANKATVKKGETLFHGTSDEAAKAITKDGFKASGKTTGVFGEGVYSTPDDRYASMYAEEAAAMARNVEAKGVLFYGTVPGGHKILDLSNTGLNPRALEKKLGVKSLAEWAKGKGLDGIKFKPISGGIGNDEVLVFNPKLADQMFGTGIHSKGDPFPSQGTPIKARPTPVGSGDVPTRQSQGKGTQSRIQQRLQARSVGAAGNPNVSADVERGLIARQQRVNPGVLDDVPQVGGDRRGMIAKQGGEGTQSQTPNAAKGRRIPTRGKARTKALEAGLENDIQFVGKSSTRKATTFDFTQPGQQPLSTRGTRQRIADNDLDVEVNDPSGGPGISPEARKSRIQAKLKKRAEEQFEERYRGGNPYGDALDQELDRQVAQSKSERRALRPTSPVTSKRKRLQRNNPDSRIPNDAPKVTQVDRRPRKGTPPTDIEKRALKDADQRMEGRQLTKDERSERRRIEDFRRKHKEVIIDEDGSVTLSAELLKEISQLPKQERLDALQRYDQIVIEIADGQRRLKELDEITLGTNYEKGSRGQRIKVRSRHKGWKGNPEQMVQDLERAEAVRRIKPETRRRMNKESEARAGRYGKIKELNRYELRQSASETIDLVDKKLRTEGLTNKPFYQLSKEDRLKLAKQFNIDTSKTTFPESKPSLERAANMAGVDTPWEYKLRQKLMDEAVKNESRVLSEEGLGKFGPNTVRAADSSKRIKQRIQERRSKDARRTRRYEDEFEKRVPMPSKEDAVKDLTKVAKEQWDDPNSNLKDLFDSYDEFLKARLSAENIKTKQFELRNQRYANEYGMFNESRLDPKKKLKTDNAAGKESVREQFREARSRRGQMDASQAIKDLRDGKPVEMKPTGDTRDRGLTQREIDKDGKSVVKRRATNPNKLDRIGRRLNSRKADATDKAVQKIQREMAGNAPLIDDEKSRQKFLMDTQSPTGQVKPFTGKPSAEPRRTVPSAPTVRDKLGPDNPPPRTAGRVRRRLVERNVRGQGKKGKTKGIYSDEVMLRRQKKAQRILDRIKNR